MTDRVAIYARVSTDEQAERQTIDNQLHACRQYAEQEGWDVVEEFRDEGVSGSVPLDERPSGKQLLTAAENKAVDRVLVYRLDRLSRDTLGCLLALKRLEALKAPAMSIDEKFDDSPNGRFHMTVMSAVAELEKNLIRQRTMAGRARSVRNGRYLASTAPFGYVRENGVLKPDRQRARVVRQMFRWAREGLGIKSIAARLEERGVEPPNPSKRKSHWGWHFTTIYKILTSPRYIGKGTYAGEPMPCKPLVDEETFYAVQAGLKRHKRDSPRNTTNFYLLQHLVYCRHCTSRYTARTVWGKDGQRTIYQCRRRTVYGKKAGHEDIKWRWHGEQLEAAIKEHVIGVLTKPDYFKHAKVYRDDTKERWGEHQVQEEDLRAQLTDLEQQEVNILASWEKGRVYRDEDQFQERLAGVRAQQEEVKAKLEALASQSPVEELTGAEKVEALAIWATTKHAVSLEGKSPDEMLASLFDGGHVRWGLVDGEDGKEWDLVQDPTAKLDSLDRLWRDVVMALVKDIWVENDGASLTVEGTIEVASGKARVGVSDVTRTR